jgi:hypothetical protein
VNDQTTHKPTLVLAGTGETGRRVVERLTARACPFEPFVDADDTADVAVAALTVDRTSASSTSHRAPTPHLRRGGP